MTETAPKTAAARSKRFLRPPRLPRSPPSTWKDLGYARCGRTDAGVSGMGQVVSLRLRSKLRRFQKVERKVQKKKKKERNGDDENDGLFASSSSSPSSSSSEDDEDQSDSEEIDYPALLNKALPPEVRVTGWAPLPQDRSFSARFSATAREYRYFFVDDCSDAATSADGKEGETSGGGGLDLRAMRRAAAALVGLHDFRNLCKPDLPAVTNFVRRILSCEVEEWTGALEDPFVKEGGAAAGEGEDEEEEEEVGAEAPPPNPLLGSSPSAARFRGYVLRVRGAAFLLHQVRCIASLLLMIGRRQEDASVVARLLDASATPRKPHYNLAPPEPLLFSGCDFAPAPLAWRRSERALDQSRLSVRELLRGRVAGIAVLGAAAARLDELAGETAVKKEKNPSSAAAAAAPASPSAPSPSSSSSSSSLFPRPPLPLAITRRHVPLFQRGSDPPLEERAAAKGYVLTTGAAPRRPAEFQSKKLALLSLAEA